MNEGPRRPQGWARLALMSFCRRAPRQIGMARPSCRLAGAVRPAASSLHAARSFATATVLGDRGVLKVEGADSFTFLQVTRAIGPTTGRRRSISSRRFQFLRRKLAVLAGGSCSCSPVARARRG